MERWLIAIVIVIVLVGGGFLLYRHFVTNRIMDKDTILFPPDGWQKLCGTRTGGWQKMPD